MSKTNFGLVNYAKAQLGNPYWWGTFGQYGTKDLYDLKKKQYPESYFWPYDSSMDNKKVHDCSGLVKGYLMCENEYASPVYNPSFDMNAAGLYNFSKEKGHISTMPKTPGILVFYEGFGHVGIYIGNDQVIQAAGINSGVIQTTLSVDPHWGYWAKCPYVHYESIEQEPTEDVGELLADIKSTLIELIAKIDKMA